MKRTYSMCNICKTRLPHAIGDVISSIGIGIGTAAADSIGYRAPERYRSNPNLLTELNTRQRQPCLRWQQTHYEQRTEDKWVYCALWIFSCLWHRRSWHTDWSSKAVVLGRGTGSFLDLVLFKRPSRVSQHQRSAVNQILGDLWLAARKLARTCALPDLLCWRQSNHSMMWSCRVLICQ